MVALSDLGVGGSSRTGAILAGSGVLRPGAVAPTADAGGLRDSTCVLESRDDGGIEPRRYLPAEFVGPEPCLGAAVGKQAASEVLAQRDGFEAGGFCGQVIDEQVEAARVTPARHDAISRERTVTAPPAAIA